MSRDTRDNVRAPLLLARCGAMREVSARLRERAQTICQASALLRGFSAGPSPLRLPGALRESVARRTVRVGVTCTMCGLRVTPRDLSLAASRPVHAQCQDARMRALEAPVAALVAATFEAPWCRRCIARRLGIAHEDVYALSARLLVRRAIRSAAGVCGDCGRPRLLVATTRPATADIL
jgi:hypothetical protein